MASVTKHLVLACSLLISYQVHGKSIGQTIADARQSVNEVASKVPLYVSSAAERVPQYAERVPQYVAKVPQYINRVPDYMGQLPQYVSGAVSQMPGIFNGATSRFPDMFQNTMRNAATEVSSAGNKLLKALGFKTKIGAAPAQSLVQGQHHQIIIQSPGYIGSPTYTVPMIPTDYKIKDGVKTLKSERPVASPLDTHAAAHAVQFGASASSSYDSYGPLYHNRHPSENEI